MLNNRLITLFACLARAPRVACTCGHSRQQQMQDAGEHINCPQYHPLLLSLFPIPISLLESPGLLSPLQRHKKFLSSLFFPPFKGVSMLGVLLVFTTPRNREWRSVGDELRLLFRGASSMGWSGTALSPPDQSGKR